MHTDIPEADITLRDGRVVHLRGVRPSDEGEVLQAFARIDDAARYMRFMRSVREPNVQKLRKVLASFPRAGQGIVATVPATAGMFRVNLLVAALARERVWLNPSE